TPQTQSTRDCSADVYSAHLQRRGSHPCNSTHGHGSKNECTRWWQVTQIARHLLAAQRPSRADTDLKRANARLPIHPNSHLVINQIGRASWRERVYISHDELC